MAGAALGAGPPRRWVRAGRREAGGQPRGPAGTVLQHKVAEQRCCWHLPHRFQLLSRPDRQFQVISVSGMIYLRGTAACSPASPCSDIGVVPKWRPALLSCCCSLPQSCQRGRSRRRKQCPEGNKAVWQGFYSKNIVSDQRSNIMMNTALHYLLYRKGPLRGQELKQAERIKKS